jgi:hypothetical protein
LNLHNLLNWKLLNFKSFPGWTVAIVTFCNAFLAAVALRFIIKRAKKCLDFAATIYIIHLILTSLYSGVPVRLDWWVVNAINLTITAVLGEWLCLQHELKEIPMSSIRRPAAAAAARDGQAGTAELASILTQQ